MYKDVLLTRLQDHAGASLVCVLPIYVDQNTTTALDSIPLSAIDCLVSDLRLSIDAIFGFYVLQCSNLGNSIMKIDISSLSKHEAS